MKSHLISGTRTVEDVLREHLREQRDAAIKPFRTPRNHSLPATAPAPSSDAVPAVTSLADYIKLENIECTDADGNIFERYDTLYVRKDIERNADNNQRNFTPYQGAVYFESQGLFLPSMALSCAIVAQLYQWRRDPVANAVLMQYKDKGNGYGWHAQNTVIDYASEKVVHYPSAAVFGQVPVINASHPTTSLSFFKETLHDSLVVDALQDAQHLRFIQQFTGLQDPSILIEIGTYFGKTAKLWFPWNGQQGSTNTEKRAAWLGCGGDYFYLNADNILGNANAARGVRLGVPAGRAAPGGSTP